MPRMPLNVWTFRFMKARIDRLVDTLGDIEVLTRPDDAEKKGMAINRDELLNDIGKLARAALAKTKEPSLHNLSQANTPAKG